MIYTLAAGEGRRQSLGRRCDHAGMDAAVAAAVPYTFEDLPVIEPAKRPLTDPAAGRTRRRNWL